MNEGDKHTLHTYNDGVILLVEVFPVDRPPLGVVGCVMVVGKSCDEEGKEPGACGRHASDSQARRRRDRHL